ncbi:MAG: hypothetical protein HQK53_04760 [Oligoflexia bacterium]|nr:hypothetical protein [Oligoflexia bacterium]
MVRNSLKWSKMVKKKTYNFFDITFKLFTLTLLTWSSINTSNGSSESLLDSGIVVFKFPDKIYFLSDVHELSLSLLRLQCLLPNSMLLNKILPSLPEQLKNFLSSDTQLTQQPQLVDKQALYNRLSANQHFFSEIALIWKILRYLQKNGINTPLPGAPEQCSNALSEYSDSKFHSKERSARMKELMAVEYFLQNKFSVNSLPISDFEVNNFLKKNPAILQQLNKEKKDSVQITEIIKKRLVTEKIRESQETFINSLNRQVHADFLWK